MRCDELYIDDVTECQGDLFSYAVQNKYDLESFAETYMRSTVRKRIDGGMAVYCTMPGEEIFHILDKSNIKTCEQWQDDIMAKWIGEFYSLVQWYSNVYSDEVVSKIKPIDVISRYNALHDMDIRLVAQKYKEKMQ